MASSHPSENRSAHGVEGGRRAGGGGGRRDAPINPRTCRKMVQTSRSRRAILRLLEPEHVASGIPRRSRRMLRLLGCPRRSRRRRPSRPVPPKTPAPRHPTPRSEPRPQSCSIPASPWPGRRLARPSRQLLFARLRAASGSGAPLDTERVRARRLCAPRPSPVSRFSPDRGPRHASARRRLAVATATLAGCR